MNNKKLYITIFFIIALSISCFAQTQEVVLADTMGNSQSRTVDIVVDVDVDSLTISLYSAGEIDLDSLDVKLGVVETIKLGTGKTTYLDFFESSNSTYSKTLTVNLADGSNAFTANLFTIPKSALKGYNRVRLTLTAASSGNDGGDTAQKAVIRKTVFK